MGSKIKYVIVTSSPVTVCASVCLLNLKDGRITDSQSHRVQTSNAAQFVLVSSNRLSNLDGL